MRLMIVLVAALLAPVMGPTAAAAQTARTHAELPSAEQPMRRVPTTGYTLSLIWTPEHCYASARHPRDGGDPECSGPGAHGFTLHGLWPDGAGPNLWPQYCHPVALLADAQIAAGARATPAPQLLQHEWAKHGSCMANDPVSYFAIEDRIYDGIHAPDMATLSHRRGLLVSDFQAAFAAANPGMRADMMRLNLNKDGWLEEVWLCLGLDRRPRSCPAVQGGAQPGDRVKVSTP